MKTTFNTVSLDSANPNEESFTGYAWLCINGDRKVHAYIEGEFKVAKVAGESKVFLTSLKMDEIGTINLLDKAVIVSEIENTIEEKLQN